MLKKLHNLSKVSTVKATARGQGVCRRAVSKSGTLTPVSPTVDLCRRSGPGIISKLRMVSNTAFLVVVVVVMKE